MFAVGPWSATLSARMCCPVRHHGHGLDDAGAFAVQHEVADAVDLDVRDKRASVRVVDMRLRSGVVEAHHAARGGVLDGRRRSLTTRVRASGVRVRAPVRRVRAPVPRVRAPGARLLPAEVLRRHRARGERLPAECLADVAQPEALLLAEMLIRRGVGLVGLGFDPFAQGDACGSQIA